MSNSKKPKKSKGLGAGIIAFGVVFALFSSLFHPHSLGGLVLTFALSAFAGGIIRTMAQGLDLTVKEKTPDSLRKMEGNTGNADVDALLERGRAMIVEIREENKKIPDASLTQKLNELENQCAEIFRAVFDKPAKAPQIRKFMDYYLPTTLKMVKGYRTLGERNLSGTDVAAARRRIEDALGIVLKGCQKMLDNLYQDDVLDITTDIDVLEQMLKRDGLTESDLEKAAAQAREASRAGAAASSAAQSAPKAAPKSTKDQYTYSYSYHYNKENGGTDDKIEKATSAVHKVIDIGANVAKQFISAARGSSPEESETLQKQAAEQAAQAQAALEAERRKTAAAQAALEAERKKNEQRELERKQAAEQAAKLAAEKAARPSTSEVPTLKWDSGVSREFQNAMTEAEQHKPQVPTLSGGYYPSYGGEATAQATKPDEQ